MFYFLLTIDQFKFWQSVEYVQYVQSVQYLSNLLLTLVKREVFPSEAATRGIL